LVRLPEGTVQDAWAPEFTCVDCPDATTVEVPVSSTVKFAWTRPPSWSVTFTDNCGVVVFINGRPDPVTHGVGGAVPGTVGVAGGLLPANQPCRSTISDTEALLRLWTRTLPPRPGLVIALCVRTWLDTKLSSDVDDSLSPTGQARRNP
jgi:hypothetical protein